MNRRAALLVVIGLTAIVGDTLRLPAIKAIGAASGASPAPRVFSAVRGLETYSTRFEIAWVDSLTGEARSIEITPETSARLRGPYTRKRVYGAALAFGPVLASDEKTRPLLESVFERSMRGDRPLLRELGVDTTRVRGPVKVRYTPRTGSDLASLPRELEIP